MEELTVKQKLFIVKNCEQKTPVQMASALVVPLSKVEKHMEETGLPVKQSDAFRIRNNAVSEYTFKSLARKRDFKDE